MQFPKNPRQKYPPWFRMACGFVAISSVAVLATGYVLGAHVTVEVAAPFVTLGGYVVRRVV